MSSVEACEVCELRRCARDTRWRRTGSEEGAADTFRIPDGRVGVAASVVVVRVMRAAILRNGEIDLPSAEADDKVLRFSGISAFEVKETRDSSSLTRASASVKSTWALAIAAPTAVRSSRNPRHRWRMSACRLKHSPFLVTLSRTPLSRTESTLLTDGT